MVRCWVVSTNFGELHSRKLPKIGKIELTGSSHIGPMLCVVPKLCSHLEVLINTAFWAPSLSFCLIGVS